MSIHNVYPEFADKVVARWQKATIHPVAGLRIDPYNAGVRITFILKTNEENYNFTEKKITFVYEDEIVELYSEAEQMLFTALNRTSIQAGMLVPYQDTRAELETHNALSDDQVLAIATMANLNKFKAALQKITSPVTLRRIAEQVPDNRAKSFDRAVTDRIESLNN